jgi:hypothetical protein
VQATSPTFSQTGENNQMNLREIYHGVISLAEAAHHLAPGLLRYPHRNDIGDLSMQDRAGIHRAGMALRDSFSRD